MRPTVWTTIRTTVDNYNAAAAAFKKLRDENQNVLLQDLYDVVYQRAQARRTITTEIWADVLADTTDRRTVLKQKGQRLGENAVDPYSIASRYAALRESLERSVRSGRDGPEGEGRRTRNGDRGRGECVPESGVLLRTVGSQASGA